MRRNSRSSTRRLILARSDSIAETVSASSSASASSRRSLLSSSCPSISRMLRTTPSSCARSRPSACARSGSFQTSGDSSSRRTSSSRSSRSAKSKIPPKAFQTALQVSDIGVVHVQFHGRDIRSEKPPSIPRYSPSRPTALRVPVRWPPGSSAGARTGSSHSVAVATTRFPDRARATLRCRLHAIAPGTEPAGPRTAK